MIPNEINQVIALAVKLWPKFEINDEQANVWYMSLREFDVAEAIGALRDHAAHSRFLPKPAEIRDRCLARRDAQFRDRPAMPLISDEDRARVERDRIEVDAVCNAMTPEDYAAHCRSAVAADWRLEWMDRDGGKWWRTSLGRAVIACRVDAGLGPNDIDPLDCVPGRITGVPRGNLNLTGVLQ